MPLNYDATGLKAGAKHYRAWVGPPANFDKLSAMQFCVLWLLGLRDHHYLLDIGCGSLRGGRLFIPYLLPGRYFGIEPEQWLVGKGIKHELGEDIVRIKQPRFDYNADFDLGVFGQTFDYLVAQSIFSHAAPAQITTCLASAHDVMHKDSIFIATYRPGEVDGVADYEGTEWVYPGCTWYRTETMVRMADEAGFSCVPYAPPKGIWSPAWLLYKLRG